MGEQEAKVHAIAARRDHAKQRAALIVETVKPLALELDKLRLIMSGLASGSGGEGEGEGEG